MINRKSRNIWRCSLVGFVFMFSFWLYLNPDSSAVVNLVDNSIMIQFCSFQYSLDVTLSIVILVYWLVLCAIDISYSLKSVISLIVLGINMID